MFTNIDRLQDDESRMIFTQRLLYYLYGNSEHLLDMLDKLEEYNLFSSHAILEEQLLKPLAELHKKNAKPIIAYGAGAFAVYLLHLLERFGIKATCLCDNNPVLWNTENMVIV